MRTIELKTGKTLAYRDKGQGPAMLLVHGWGVSGDLFDDQTRELSDRFRVIVPDLPGHGASDPLAHESGFDGLADAMVELIEQLALEAPCLVGWSLGAMVCWDLLDRHPELNIGGLVIIDMVPRLLNDREWVFGLREGQDFHAFDRDIELILSDWPAYTDLLVPRWLGTGAGDDVPELLERIKVSTLGNEPTSMAKIWSLLVEQDLSAALPDMQLPTLVLMGGKSSLYEVPAGEWIVSQMPAAHLEVFEQSGHAPHLDQPQRFNQLLAGFVSNLNSKSAGKHGTHKNDGGSNAHVKHTAQ